jgi:hypothetical protein
MRDVLYSGKVYALHAQVALFDAEDADSYPQWKTGTEDAVLGPKGVAVATASDTEIEVTVYKGKRASDEILCISGEIQVGDQGLVVGNIVSGDFAQLAWPPGQTSVDVYTNGRGEEVTRVVFVVESLE